LCFPGQRCFVHFTKANALFRQSHQGLAASVEVNTCLERAKGGVSQFAEFCGLLLLPGTRMVWTVHAWSRCQVRLSPPAAASLGSGEPRFGAARSSPWSWGTLCPISARRGTHHRCWMAVPEHCVAAGSQACVGVTGGEGHAQHGLKLDLHLLSSPHAGRARGGGTTWDTAQPTFPWVGSRLEFLPCPQPFPGGTWEGDVS